MAILTRHRAQCIVNFQAVQFVLPHFTVRGKLEVATSLGFQGRTATHVVLCLPLDQTRWNSFHLEPKALFNILGRTSQTLYMFRHTGDVEALRTLPGRWEIARLLQHYEPGRVGFIRVVLHGLLKTGPANRKSLWPLGHRDDALLGTKGMLPI